VTIGADHRPEAPPAAGWLGELTNPRLLFLILALPLLCQWMVWFYWPAAHGLDVTGHPIGRDFINVWAGPRLAFGGEITTLFDPEAYHAAIDKLFGTALPFHFWSYPPFTLPAFWPLAQLPYFAALAVWTLGLFGVLAAVTLSAVAPHERGYALTALALSPACLINAIGGQNGFLSAALLLGGTLLIDRRPILAGVLFGLLTFKPHLGLVLAFALVALAAWRVIAAAIVTALVLVAVSVAIFGIEPWRQYVEFTSAFQVHLLERFNGYYRFMMVSGVAGARTFGLGYPLAMALQIALTVAVVAIACWAVRATSDPLRRALVLASATPLATPYAFNYDLTALATVVVWSLCRPLPPDGRTAILFLAWIIPVLSMYLNWYGWGLTPLVLAAVFALAVYECRADRRPSPAGPMQPAAA
jgi:alpha-1,2-mannosyltransferase